MEDGDDVMLDGALAGTEEFRGEAVGARCLACGHALDGVPNLLFREWRVQLMHIISWVDQLLKIESAITSRSHADDAVEVSKSGLGHLSLVGEHPICGGEAEDCVLLSVVGTLPMEEGRVRVAVFKGRNARMLPSNDAFQGGEAEVGAFEAFVKLGLVRSELPILLCLVKFEDELPANGELLMDITH